jgi:hypothetical protein
MLRLLGAFISCSETTAPNPGIAMAATETPEITAEQVVEAIYQFAAEQMRNGASPAEIKRRLIEQGLSAEAAGIVVSNLGKAISQSQQEAAQKNMLYGAVWCIGGIVVTALTYAAASGGGGGSYVVAWGAIVFGAVQFFRGLGQSAEVGSA